MTTDHEDLTLRLPDGRRLGYGLHGAADGYPVVSCHGGLSCRIDLRVLAAALVQYRIAVLGRSHGLAGRGGGLAACGPLVEAARPPV